MDEYTVPLKRCKICGFEKPSEPKYFRPVKSGFYATCRKCESAAALVRHYANRDKNLARMKARYDNDINGEKARVRANTTRYRKENPDKVKASKAASIQKKPELYKKSWQDWRHNNPDKVKVISHNRMARKKALPDTFTSEQWLSCLDYWHNRCVYCGTQQGLWNPITADHFIPLSSPDCTGTIAKNMLPCCQSCNCSKWKLDARDWLRTSRPRDYRIILASIAAYFDSLTD